MTKMHENKQLYYFETRRHKATHYIYDDTRIILFIIFLCADGHYERASHANIYEATHEYAVHLTDRRPCRYR